MRARRLSTVAALIVECGVQRRERQRVSQTETLTALSQQGKEKQQQRPVHTADSNHTHTQTWSAGWRERGGTSGSVRARAALLDTPSSRCSRARTDWLRHCLLLSPLLLDCSSVQIHFLLLQNRQGKTRLGEWTRKGCIGNVNGATRVQRAMDTDPSPRLSGSSAPSLCVQPSTTLRSSMRRSASSKQRCTDW